MPETNPIRRLERRLSRPARAEFMPATDPVEKSELLHEIVEIAIAGGLARQLAPAYAFSIIATVLTCLAGWEEPGRGAAAEPSRSRLGAVGS